jgi:hypothetical protein
VLGFAPLAAVVVAAGLAGSPVAPAAERVHASGVVLFVEALGGAAHVVQVGADGTRRERLLTLTRKKIGAVAFSTDRRRVAFVETRANTKDRLLPGTLVVVDLESGERRGVASNLSPGNRLSWSPDDTEIAYVDAATGAVYVASAGGEAKSRLLRAHRSGADFAFAVWSPVADLIAIVWGEEIDDGGNNPDYDGTVELVSRSGRLVTRLDQGFVEDLQWSPNGRRLALFYPYSGSSGDVFIAPGWKLYSSMSGGPVSAATWSPRGTRLLLVEYPEEVGLPPLIGLVLPKRGTDLSARDGIRISGRGLEGGTTRPYWRDPRTLVLGGCTDVSFVLAARRCGVYTVERGRLRLLATAGSHGCFGGCNETFAVAWLPSPLSRPGS